MVRGIDNRVKISQIVDSQLPQFITDTLSIVEETSTYTTNSGTYSRSGNSVSVYSSNHQLSLGQKIYVEYISGYGTTGFYNVSQIVDNNTFTIFDEVSGNTSGSLNYKKYSEAISPEKIKILSDPASYDKFISFLRQYYISQEYQSGPVDIIDNFNNYISLDNLVPESIIDSTTITASISDSDETINVSNTKGFPDTYGLIKIDDEIITYTSKDSTHFYGCIRGFSGVTNYHSDLSYEELLFSKTDASSHLIGANVDNLSILFLKEFFRKLKYSLVPGLENVDFIPELNVGNFIKESRSLYEVKGTEESFKILFKILFGENVNIIDLEKFLLKPSDATYIRRNIGVVEVISGDPINLKGQTIFKENDSEVTASISDIQPFTRNGKLYYKVYLFIGYDDSKTYVTGNFDITSSSKSIDNVDITESPIGTVTVDSTIGFPNSGYFLHGGRKVFYASKTITQFLGCYSESGTISIKKTDNIISSETYYGYENGDTSKKVELRFGGVLDKVSFFEDDNLSNFNYIVGDEILVKNLGEVIKNPEQNKSNLEIFSNSWIYNTSCRFQIKSFITASQFELYLSPDKSNLKLNDKIEILQRGTENVVFNDVLIESITNNEVEVNVDLSSLEGLYDIRRIQNKAKTTTPSSISIKYGNDSIVSDILNLYKDENDDNLVYVASNSLPSYEIDSFINSYEILSLEDFDDFSGKYSTIQFSNSVSFIDGDRVVYVNTEDSIIGLENESYYVQIINSERTRIRLYLSRSLVGTSNYIEFGSNTGILPNGQHKIVLYSQQNTEVSPQKIFKKFNLNSNIDYQIETPVGSVGMLVNGVEILGYKTTDKIFYGPVESVDILSKGSGYDVINPPKLEFDTGNAKIQPVVTGSFEKMLVSSQPIEVSDNISINVTGGNGFGAKFEPIITEYQREVSFDAREIINGGGIDIDLETITFLSPHGFVDGQEVIYDSSGNDNLGISSYQASNLSSGNTLQNNTSYFVSLVNSSTIQLYPSFNDYNSGINTIGITTVGNYGVHKFKTLPVNTLSNIFVSDPGSGYSNRKLRVKPAGISTTFNIINYNEHGFSDGEIISYSYENIGIETSFPISGLSTSNNYYILKIDEDRFQLADAGIGATISDNYDSRRVVDFSDVGVGYQVFNYPEIQVNLSYSTPGIGTTAVINQIDIIPVVRGEIESVYVYEGGEDYGSSILNINKSPSITVKNGTGAQLVPIISNGEIVDVQILSGGTDYYSYPDLIVTSSTGKGAALKAIITNNSISSVEVLNYGSGYDINSTSISVIPAGKNSKFNSNVRSLTLNNAFKYGEFIGVGTEFYRKSSDEVTIEFGDETLQFMQLTYSSKLMGVFGDNNSTHSKIIGWAYDGNPIYGPYGYSDPEDSNSSVKKLESGYSLKTIENPPSGFFDEFFTESFEFNNSGDLDEYNGRFCKTPEFPNGVYAYFATVKNDPYSGQFIGQFPYFIGNYYRSYYDRDESISITQDFDFNSSNLIRNTLPYAVNQEYADNDFIVESNELFSQRSIVESINSGKIDNFTIVNSGNDYSINDRVLFNDNSSLLVKVSEIKGKDIEKITTVSELFTNSIVSKVNDDKIKVSILPYHNLLEDDVVNLTGFSSSLLGVSGFYNIGFSTYYTSIVNALPDASTSGIITTFQVSYIPTTVSIGSSIKINSEEFEILDTYYEQSVLKVRRSSSGVAHTTNSIVEFLPDSFIINTNGTTISEIDSRLDNIAYFVPKESVGLGTVVGVTSSLKSYVGETLTNIEIPTQSIYIRNHPFRTNQKVVLTKKTSTDSLEVSNESGGLTFNIPPVSEDSQILYVINKSKDYIGLVTSVGLTTESNGLFFTTYNGTEDELFKIETDYVQEFCTVSRIRSIVTTKENHSLQENDFINFRVKPKNSTGISTQYVNVKYSDNLLLVDEVNISSGISTLTDIITLSSHGYQSGDLVYYNSSDNVAEGLTTGRYFITKINDNNFKLSLSYIDSISNPPINVSIGTSAGGLGQKLSKINPKLTVYKNNNLTFDLSDSSLIGYNLKIYYDNDFNKEFVSVENLQDFVVSGVGTIGVSTDAKVTIQYSNSIPDVLYYNLEKSGHISTSDKSNPNYSKIEFVDSVYNGNYNIFGVGSTTFSFSINENPEVASYFEDECDLLEYSTTSNSASGPIEKVKTFSIKRDYDNLPSFDSIVSENGYGGFVVANSKQIGTPNLVRILTNGFDYPSDKTLRPSASVPTELILKNSHIIDTIDVNYGGNNYLSPPNIIAINPQTLEKIDGGIIKAYLSGSTVGYVDVEVSPKQLPEEPVILRAVDNTNGIIINEVYSSLSGIVTCILSTPIIGFSTDPFQVGDKIYVENIVKYSSDGDGFNSENYGYQFFEVSAYYAGSNPGKVEFNISGLTTNPGIAKTIQESFATIIKDDFYPIFTANQSPAKFNIGEKIISDSGFGFESRDLVVKNSESLSIRVSGTYDLSVGDVIRGIESGYEGIVDEIRTSKGKYEISAYSYERIGWFNDTGKLNESSQVIEDNDYYQNLSYSVKSKRTWDEISSPVNSLLHTSGLKNFSDTEFIGTISAGITSAIDSVLTITSDIISENRVDTINFFDLNVDSDISN